MPQKKKKTRAIKKSVINDAFSRMKSKPSVIYFCALFDLLMVLVIMLLNYTLDMATVPANAGGIWQVIVYLIAVAIVYSCAKFLVQKKIASVFNEDKLEFKRIGSFIVLNFMNFIFILIVATLLSAVAMATMGQSLLAAASYAVYAIVFLLLYPLLGLSHYFFAMGKNVWKSFLLGLKCIFTKIARYWVVYAAFIAAAALFCVIVLLAQLVIGFVFKEEIITSNLTGIVVWSAYLGLLLFYLAHLFNRIYFFGIARSFDTELKKIKNVK